MQMNGIGKAQVGIISVLALMLVSMKRRLPERRLSSGITTLALAGIVLLVAAGSASAHCNQTDDASCHGCCYLNSSDSCTWCYEGNDTVTEDCTFDANITVSDAGETGAVTHGLRIGADEITVDGDGYILTGAGCVPDVCYCEESTDPSPYCHSGIVNTGYNNVTIKNITITNFCQGISMKKESAGGSIENCTVERSTIRHNGYIAPGPNWDDERNPCAIFLYNVDNSTVTNCTIYNQSGQNTDACWAGGHGVRFHQRADHNTVTNNTIHDCEGAGVYAKMQSKYEHVAYNHIYHNGFDKGGYEFYFVSGGIKGACIHSSNWTIENNTIENNTGPGIFMGGEYNTIRYNTIKNSTSNTPDDNWGHGIGVDLHRGGRGNTVSFNNITGHEEYGIYVQYQDLYTEIHNNTVCLNGDADIYVRDRNSGYSGTTTGDNNTCDTTYNYDDEGTSGCTYHCPASVGPDLIISDLTVKWVTGQEGMNYTVNYTVKNIGTQNRANASNVSIRIDSTLQFTDTNVPELDALATYTNETSSYTLSGVYDTIEVCADCDNNVTETREDNNCTTDVFGGPDLIVSGTPHLEWSCKQTKTYYVNYTIKNDGDSSSSACNVSVKVNEEGGAEIIRPCAALSAGATNTSLAGPFTMSGNSDIVRVTVDCNGTVTENDETNNWTQWTPEAPADPPEDGYVAYKYQVDGSPGADDPSIEFNSTEYAAIKANDSLSTCNTTTTDGDYAAHRFNFSIDGTNPEKINATWIGKGWHDGPTDGAKLYIWNFTSAAYEELDTKSVGTEVTLTGGVVVTTSSDYVNSGNVTILAKQKSAHDEEDGASHICTDYVKLVVTP